jgi:hypothetical protein
MLKNQTSGKIASAALFTAAMAGALLFAGKPAAAQEESGKKFCVGCSVDGKTTPRAADGHPDISGMWGGGFGGGAPAPAPAAGAAGGAAPAARGGAAPAAAGGGGRGGAAFQRLPDGSILFDFGTEYNDQEGGGRICQSESCQAPNQPKYNDAYMPKVKAIAKTEFGGTTALDPIQSCRASGVPRAGAPSYIMQSPDVIVFLYNAAPYSTYRMIYMNGRPHPDMKTYETTYFGDSIGHWDGDTLVVDTVGFNDDTWLGGGGPVGTVQFTSIHSEKEQVIERLTRNGDAMSYEVTVEDPDALSEPWKPATRNMRHAGPGMENPGVDAPDENICTPTADHIVQPNPEDKDIKLRCGYRCEDAAGGAKKNY